MEPKGVERADSVYSKASAEQAWSKRRDELHLLADVGEVLSDIDQQIADLQQRVNALLDGELT